MTKLSNTERAAKIATTILSIAAASGIVFLIASAIIEQLSREPGVVTLF